jgi:hypothetical protein
MHRSIVPMYREKRQLVAAPRLSYGGMQLITSAEVYTIFWGADWLQVPQSALVPQINQFFDVVLTSSLLDLLAIYSVPGMTIGHGTRIGTTTIGTSQPGRGTNNLTDAQIQQAIQQWIGNNTIPQPNNNTLYFIYLPPNVGVSDAQGQASCTDMCGYHWYVAGSQIVYAVVPFPNCAGCLGGLGTLQAITSTSSHELCEAITDPIVGGGWYDFTNNCEIAGLCAWQTAVIGGFTVQKIWNINSGCAVSPGAQWHDNDLSKASNAAQTVSGDPMGFEFSAQATQSVVFLGQDNHICQLYWTATGWGCKDLTADAHAPQLAAGDPMGFEFSAQATQSVVFRGQDNHIYQLYWTVAGWGCHDLTAWNYGTLNAGGDAMGWEFGGIQHVAFANAIAPGVSAHVHEFWWSYQP